MSDDVKKAICLAGAWCFDSYLELKDVFTQEQTKRLISLDAKNIRMMELKAGSTCKGE